eukprot:GSA120T00021154001.1
MAQLHQQQLHDHTSYQNYYNQQHAAAYSPHSVGNGTPSSAMCSPFERGCYTTMHTRNISGEVVFYRGPRNLLDEMVMPSANYSAEKRLLDEAAGNYVEEEEEQGQELPKEGSSSGEAEMNKMKASNKDDAEILDEEETITASAPDHGHPAPEGQNKVAEEQPLDDLNLQRTVAKGSDASSEKTTSTKAAQDQCDHATVLNNDVLVAHEQQQVEQ